MTEEPTVGGGGELSVSRETPWGESVSRETHQATDGGGETLAPRSDAEPAADSDDDETAGGGWHRPTAASEVDGSGANSGQTGVDLTSPDQVSRETAEHPLRPVGTEPAPAALDDPNSGDPDGVSRETTEKEADSARDRRAGSDYETPIAREAAQAVRVLNVRQEQWPRPPHPRVLTVANQKGGVGKTTSAVNIAAALALHGLRVLLIDLDPQGNASTALGIEHSVGTPSIYDVLLGGRPIVDVMQTAGFAPSLRCIPATLDLAGADIELTSQVAREYRLQRALMTFLDTESADFDYVLIDCPPSLGLLTLNALVAAREVLLPIQCEYYALEGLAQLLKTVDLVTSHLNPQLEVTTVLLTMYDSRTRLADQVADEVRRHFGDLVLEPTIPRNVRVSEAPGFGQTVITYDPGSRGAVGYVHAAREIAERGVSMNSEKAGVDR